jgi:hypothetical protein
VSSREYVIALTCRRDAQVRKIDGIAGRAKKGPSMTDLERLGLALVGFALAVIVGGVLLGLIGAWITKAK